METNIGCEPGSENRFAAAGYNELTWSIRKEIAGFASNGIKPVTLHLDVAESGDAILLSAGSWSSSVRLDPGTASCFVGKPACGRRPGTPGPCRIFDPLPEDMTVNLVTTVHSISYLPHGVAVCLLQRLRRLLPTGGKLFISALGLHSDLGDRYPHADREISQRYAAITTPDAGHPMSGTRLCLYAERDLVLTLLSSGWSVLRSSSTTEGNVLASAAWNPGLNN